MAEQPAIRPRRSLRNRLIVSLLTGVALAWIVSASLSYMDVREEVDQMLDGHLAQSASVLLASSGSATGKIEAEHAPVLHRYTVNVAFQVWDKGKTLRLHSANAPNKRLSMRDEGFSDVMIGGKIWRVFSAWTADRGTLVQVADERHLRNEIVEDVGEHMLLPLAIALLLLGLLTWFTVSREVRPLRCLGEDIAARDPDDLSPVDSIGVPAEVSPLVDNFNFLLARVSSLMESERRFTADAAHELRSPLAALRAQAQVARAEGHEATRVRALDNVIAGCDRAARVVEQLLTLARLEPDTLALRRERCDLARVARDVAAEAAPFALDRGVDIQVVAPESWTVSGTPDLMRVLIRNLVDNAVRYSSGPATVTVKVSAAERALAVLDRGPGVPPDERLRLGQRFHRILGTGQSGSGLGLSIVARIAELHGATVSFEANREDGKEAGLRVSVRFPEASI